MDHSGILSFQRSGKTQSWYLNIPRWSGYFCFPRAMSVCQKSPGPRGNSSRGQFTVYSCCHVAGLSFSWGLCVWALVRPGSYIKSLWLPIVIILSSRPRRFPSIYVKQHLSNCLALIFLWTLWSISYCYRSLQTKYFYFHSISIILAPSYICQVNPYHLASTILGSCCSQRNQTTHFYCNFPHHHFWSIEDSHHRGPQGDCCPSSQCIY